MGGEGASSNLEVNKRRNLDGEPVPYGTTYKTLGEFGMFKIIQGKKDSLGKWNNAPMESQTPHRKYVYLDKSGDFSEIVYIGGNLKRYKSIGTPHFTEKEKKFHVHYGYRHNEYTKNNKPRELTSKEWKDVKKVLKELDKRGIKYNKEMLKYVK